MEVQLALNDEALLQLTLLRGAAATAFQSRLAAFDEALASGRPRATQRARLAADRARRRLEAASERVVELCAPTLRSDA